MRKIIIIVAFLCFNLNSSQEVNYNDLLDFIKDKGCYKSSLSSYTLDSSWLNKVTAYSYKYKIYVVAETKKSEYSFQTNTYIFCRIPPLNWTNFKYRSYNDSDSYRERFHKYILNYKCNCK